MNIPTKYFHCGNAAAITAAKGTFTHPEFRLSIFDTGRDMDEIVKSFSNHPKSIAIHCVFGPSCDRQEVIRLQATLSKRVKNFVVFHYQNDSVNSLTEIKASIQKKAGNDARRHPNRNTSSEGKKKGNNAQQKKLFNQTGYMRKTA